MSNLSQSEVFRDFMLQSRTVRITLRADREDPDLIIPNRFYGDEELVILSGLEGECTVTMNSPEFLELRFEPRGEVWQVPWDLVYLIEAVDKNLAIFFPGAAPDYYRRAIDEAIQEFEDRTFEALARAGRPSLTLETKSNPVDFADAKRRLRRAEA